MLIALDAGHGNGDPGAVNKELGLTEAEVNYRLVQIIRFFIWPNEALLIPRNLVSSQRAYYADTYGAKILISIHQNAGSPSAHGFEIYYHHGNQEGAKLAKAIAAKLEEWSLYSRGVIDDYYWHPPEEPTWTGGLGILRYFPGPAVLIESLFITNVTDVRIIQDDVLFQELGRRIALGINDYVGANVFNDVSDPETNEALNFLYKAGIVKGTGSGAYRPDDPLTRGQVALLLYRLLKYIGKGG